MGVVQAIFACDNDNDDDNVNDNENYNSKKNQYLQRISPS